MKLNIQAITLFLLLTTSQQRQLNSSWLEQLTQMRKSLDEPVQSLDQLQENLSSPLKELKTMNHQNLDSNIKISDVSDAASLDENTKNAEPEEKLNVKIVFKNLGESIAQSESESNSNSSSLSLEEMGKIQYPINLAPRGDTVDTYKSKDGKKSFEVADPYRFLENPDSDATKKWVEAENKITDNFLGKLNMKDKIVNRMKDLGNQNQMSIPTKRGDYYYFSHSKPKQNQPVMYKMKQKGNRIADKEKPEEAADVFINPNEWKEEGHLEKKSQNWATSGKYLLYTVNKKGSDWQQAYIIDSITGKTLPDEINWIKFAQMDWSSDEKGFFYNRYPTPKNLNKKSKTAKFDDKAGAKTEAVEFEQVFYHRLNTSQDKDILIHEDKKNKDYMNSPMVTQDGKYLIMSTRKDTKHINLLSYADISQNKLDKEIEFTPLITEWIGSFSVIHNVGTQFYIQTNYKAPKDRVIMIDIATFDPKNLDASIVEVIPEHKTLINSGSSNLGGKLVVKYMEDASDRVYIYEFGTPAKLLNKVALPKVNAIHKMEGRFDEPTFVVSCDDFISPGTAYEVNVNDFSMKIIKKAELADKTFKSEDYAQDQLFYPSKDGTKIPMYIVRKKSTLPTIDSKPSKPIPVLLYGYGGFGKAQQPSFDVSNYIMAKNMDAMYVSANIRGGGEYGEEWHTAAIKDKKQTSYDDFIAAAEFLIKQGYTDAKHIVIQGGSNGGTLVTACANQRPDLFAGVIAQVAVTDMLRFQKFTIGKVWCPEYGCSDKDGGAEYILKYSPLHTIKAQKYPAMLIETGDHDDRVVPLHSYKYTAELQFRAGNGKVQGQSPLLLKVSKDQGHSGGGNKEVGISDAANSMAFMALITGAKWTD